MNYFTPLSKRTGFQADFEFSTSPTPPKRGRPSFSSVIQEERARKENAAR